MLIRRILFRARDTKHKGIARTCILYVLFVSCDSFKDGQNSIRYSLQS